MAKAALILIVVVCTQISCGEGGRGVAINSASLHSLQCLRKKEYHFVVVDVSNNNNAGETIKHARQAGFKMVDGYIFPCPKCDDAKKEVRWFCWTLLIACVRVYERSFFTLRSVYSVLLIGNS